MYARIVHNKDDANQGAWTNKIRSLFIGCIILTSVSITPLFSEYSYIGTMLLIPSLALFYIITKTKQILSNRIIVLYASFIAFSFFTYFLIVDEELFFSEIRALIVTLLLTICLIGFISSDIDRLRTVLWIFWSKFILMIVYTLWFFDRISVYLVKNIRVNSGMEVGINANAYGYFGFIAIFSIFLIALRSAKVVDKILFFMTCALAIGTTFFMASRAGLIANFAASIIFAYLLGYRLFAIIFASAAAIVGGSATIVDTVAFQRMNDFLDSKEDMRLHHVVDGFERFTENPIGYGAGQFSHYDSYQGVSHNTFIYLAHDYGVSGILIGAAFIILFYDGLRKLKGQSNKRFAIFAFYILALLYSNFYIFLNNAYIMSFLMVLYHLTEGRIIGPIATNFRSRTV